MKFNLTSNKSNSITLLVMKANEKTIKICACMNKYTYTLMLNTIILYVPNDFSFIYFFLLFLFSFFVFLL